MKKAGTGKRIKTSHPTKRTRLRVTLLRLAKLLRDDPKTFAKSSERLGTMLKQGEITLKTGYRILNAPVSYTTLKSKLRQFNEGKIDFDQLMESVNNAYSRQVPERKIKVLLRCREGEFYHKVEELADAYKAPKSFLTEMAIRRMKYLKYPKEEIDEAERIKWGIHQQYHKLHEAQKKGNEGASSKARGRILELEHIFFEKFAKRL